MTNGATPNNSATNSATVGRWFWAGSLFAWTLVIGSSGTSLAGDSGAGGGFSRKKLATGVAQQDPVPDDTQAKRTLLGERQRLVERKMVELESKFTAIAEQLAAKEPERAARLIAAYQKAKESLLTERMAQISRLLDQNKFAEAQQLLDEVIVSLEELVRLLIDQRGQKLDKDQEIKMLEEWKKDLQQVQQEQQRTTRETDNIANREAALEKLAAQIKELNQLIERQKAVEKQTEERAGQGLRALDKVADEQFALRQQTERLSNSIAETPSDPNSPNSNGESSAGNSSAPAGSEAGSPPKTPRAETPPRAETDPATPPAAGETTPPTQGQPASSSPSSSQPTPGQAGDSAGQPNNNSGSENRESPAGKPSTPPRPGQAGLQQAQQHQRQAEEKLASGKAQDAQRQQQQAIGELEKALAELEKEQRRIASLPPDALQQVAAEQQRTRAKTMEVARAMKEAPPPAAPESSGENAPSPNGQPGQQSVEQAEQSMQQATQDLSEQDSAGAQQQQAEAEQKIQQALDEIEERLSQLREETREEKLARLEGRFREMLERQKVATIMTTEVQDKRSGLGQLSRRDQLILLRLATEESEISELGQQAYDLLLEDGTSVVFPEVVQNLREDLLTASNLLAAERTDPLTQIVQREIESALEELIDSLQKSQKKNEGGGGGGGGGGGKQPLLEKSAELKMLRVSQQRINRQTKQLDRIFRERPADGQLQKEIETTANRQLQLLEMTERMLEEGD